MEIPGTRPACETDRAAVACGQLARWSSTLRVAIRDSQMGLFPAARAHILRHAATRASQTRRDVGATRFTVSGPDKVGCRPSRSHGPPVPLAQHPEQKMKHAGAVLCNFSHQGVSSGLGQHKSSMVCQPAFKGVVLRTYQQAALEAVLSSYKSGLVRLLVVMPTGAGKTITFATLARIMNCRTLVLVHRTHLIDQTVDAFRRVWPEVQVGCLQGKRNQVDAQVVVATVQTAYTPRRLESLGAGEGFGLCVVDEAHHAPTCTYQKVFERLGFLRGDPQKLLLGVTATPYRDCKLQLSDTFEALPYEINIGELISIGALCRIKAQRILTYTDLTNAQLKAPAKATEDDVADFNPEQLSLLINTPERNRLVAFSYKRLARGRKAIAFACSIKHANDMAAEFNKCGVLAASLHSNMSKQDQDDVRKRHKDGQIKVLTNVGMLTEGYDDTSISCVLMARPTRSRALYTQCVGRGFRVSPGKQDCLVLDFTDTHHSVDKLVELMDIQCMAEGQEVELRDYDKEPPGAGEALAHIIPGGTLSLYEMVEYAWVRSGSSFYLGLWSKAPWDVFFQLRPVSDLEVAELDCKVGITSNHVDRGSEAEGTGQGRADGVLHVEAEPKSSVEAWQLSFLIESSLDPWTPDMWEPLAKVDVARVDVAKVDVARGSETKAWLRAVQFAEARLEALQQTSKANAPLSLDDFLFQGAVPYELWLFLQALNQCKIEGGTDGSTSHRNQPCNKMQRQRILKAGVKEQDMRQWVQQGLFLGQSPPHPVSPYSPLPSECAGPQSSSDLCLPYTDDGANGPLRPSSPSSSSPAPSVSSVKWVEGLTFGQASDLLTLLHVQSRLRGSIDHVAEEPKAQVFISQQQLQGLRFWATAARLVMSSAHMLLRKASGLFGSQDR